MKRRCGDQSSGRSQKLSAMRLDRWSACPGHVNSVSRDRQCRTNQVRCHQLEPRSRHADGRAACRHDRSLPLHARQRPSPTPSSAASARPGQDATGSPLSATGARADSNASPSGEPHPPLSFRAQARSAGDPRIFLEADLQVRVPRAGGGEPWRQRRGLIQWIKPNGERPERQRRAPVLFGKMRAQRSKA